VMVGWWSVDLVIDRMNESSVLERRSGNLLPDRHPVNRYVNGCLR
jgi:hypothetical protein